MSQRRFPPPWTVEDIGAEVQHRAFVIKDKNGQALAYVVGARETTAATLGLD